MVARVLLTGTVPPAVLSVGWCCAGKVLLSRVLQGSAQRAPIGGACRAMAQTKPANSRAIAVTDCEVADLSRGEQTDGGAGMKAGQPRLSGGSTKIWPG